MGKEIKKVLIISESVDGSTNKVIEWLISYGIKFERKNVDVDFKKFSININNKLKTNFDNYIIWNRRGYIPITPHKLYSNIWGNFLKQQQLTVIESIESFINKQLISSYSKEYQNNKIINLQTAKECGFKVPKTIITNNKEDLFSFIKKNKSYITKSIYLPPNVETKEFKYFGSGTIELDLKNIDDFFAPSLIQEYVEKEFEIRVFFINNKFYPMAIFSQNDYKTKIDYRNYNIEKPNRNIPFKLPNNLEIKILKFINKLECNSGSIDIIYSTKKKYVFLEINPMGQYDWVSQYCNYNIDKKIAEMIKDKLLYE
ncbi:hypothetical protein [Flavobacterium sp.]|uniref:hypothetical protein n=1 Tax=Flavobacterium sp. TaxID=239 RepID=UPI0037501D11